MTKQEKDEILSRKLSDEAVARRISGVEPAPRIPTPPAIEGRDESLNPEGPLDLPIEAIEGKEEAKLATDTVWKVIEHFQDMREIDDECIDTDTWSDKVLSYNEVEYELYEILEKIDPTKKPSEEWFEERRKEILEKIKARAAAPTSPAGAELTPENLFQGSRSLTDQEQDVLRKTMDRTAKKKPTRGAGAERLCPFPPPMTPNGGEPGAGVPDIYVGEISQEAANQAGAEDEGNMPEEMKEWVKKISALFAIAMHVNPEDNLAIQNAHSKGAEAMWRKMHAYIDDATLLISKDRLDLSAAQARIAELEAKVEEQADIVLLLQEKINVHVMTIKEQNDWIHSHI